MNDFIYCRHCNKPIVFIRTRSGKSMPCESMRADYVPDEKGPHTIMTPGGELIRGWVLDEACADTEQGYLPHWAYCTGAAKAKKGGAARSAATGRRGGKPGGRRAKAAGPNKKVSATSDGLCRTPGCAATGDDGFEQLSMFAAERVRLKELHL